MQRNFGNMAIFSINLYTIPNKIQNLKKGLIGVGRVQLAAWAPSYTEPSNFNVKYFKNSKANKYFKT